MTGADPTVEFLRKLADDSQWAIRRGVPIFEPHQRGDIEVDAEDLDEIAENSNRLLTERGVPGRLTDVHTIRKRADGAGYEPVPSAKLLGFEKNYRVGTYGPDNRPCILVDWYVFPERAAQVDRSPHRSVEYQPANKLIRGCAVMMNDPFLDMGVCVFGAGNEKILCYSMGAGMDGDQKTDKPNPDANGDKKPKGEQPTPEEEKLFNKMCSYMRVKYNLDENWPAAKNPDAPTDQPKPKEGDDKPKEPVTPMSTDKTIATYEKKLADLSADFDKKLAEANARVAGIELERDQERAKALMDTGLVGYSLTEDERKREFEKLCKMTQSERSQRVEELKTLYANRKPPEGKLLLYTGHVEGGDKSAGDPAQAPWYHEAAMTYMRDHPGTQYDAACSHIMASAAKK